MSTTLSEETLEQLIYEPITTSRKGIASTHRREKTKEYNLFSFSLSHLSLFYFLTLSHRRDKRTKKEQIYKQTGQIDRKKDRLIEERNEGNKKNKVSLAEMSKSVEAFSFFLSQSIQNIK